MTTNQVEELARVTGTIYRDEAVVYGDTFSYTLGIPEDFVTPFSRSPSYDQCATTEKLSNCHPLEGFATSSCPPTSEHVSICQPVDPDTKKLKNSNSCAGNSGMRIAFVLASRLGRCHSSNVRFECQIRMSDRMSACGWGTIIPLAPPSGPVTGSFNGLHPKSNFLIAIFSDICGGGKPVGTRSHFPPAGEMPLTIHVPPVDTAHGGGQVGGPGRIRPTPCQ